MARSRFLNQKLLAVAIAQAVACSTAHAADITVNSLADSGTDCTLRLAIESANDDIAVAGCETGDGADIIVFDPAVLPGTITLAGTELPIASAITLQGPGAGQLTINADGNSRVINVDDGDGMNLTAASISGVTLQGGSVSGNGGGIRNRENLTVHDVLLVGNAGLYGGGIENVDATLTLSNSTLQANTAFDGGGLLNRRGTVESINNTFSGNIASRYGGAIRNANDGSAMLSLTNNTLTGNSAGNLGDGIANQNSLALQNTLIANGAVNSDCISSGTITTNDNNFIGDGTCSPDLSGDPMLGPLAANDGSTPTHALLRDSPAIGAGNGCPATDQRGIARQADCDIGAYHWRALDSADIVVNSTADSVADDGVCTLREALIAANTDTASGMQVSECVAGERVDTITFNPSVSGTINLSGTQLEITSAVTLQGPGADQLTIDAGGSSRVFFVNDSDNLSNVVVTIAGLTLSGGNGGSVSVGGGVYNAEALSLNNSTLSGNSAKYAGGGYSRTGSLSLNNSTVSGNSAESTGGGIYSRSGSLSLENSTLSGNTAIAGGGTYSYSGIVSLNNSTLSGNTAATVGGIFSRGLTAVSLNNVLMANVNGNCSNVTPPTGDNNIFTDATCLTDGANQVVAVTGIGPLQDNGGSTLTHALLPGSPAIDAGNNAICSSTDQTGMPRPVDGDSDGTASCDVGAFEFTDLFGPTAQLSDAPDVTMAGGTSYAFRITYSDDAPIDAASIDFGDVTVTPSLAFAGLGLVSSPDGRILQVTYTLTPPGGQWDSSDNGIYSLTLNGDEVFDTAVTGPNAAAEQALGSFTVSIVTDAIFADGFENP